MHLRGALVHLDGSPFAGFHRVQFLLKVCLRGCDELVLLPENLETPAKGAEVMVSGGIAQRALESVVGDGLLLALEDLVHPRLA